MQQYAQKTIEKVKDKRKNYQKEFVSVAQNELA